MSEPRNPYVESSHEWHVWRFGYEAAKREREAASPAALDAAIERIVSVIENDEGAPEMWDAADRLRALWRTRLTVGATSPNTTTYDAGVTDRRTAISAEAASPAALDVLREMADACEGLMPFVRLGSGPLGADPAAKALRRAFYALGAARAALAQEETRA